MLKHLALTAALALSLGAGAAWAQDDHGGEASQEGGGGHGGEGHIEDIAFSFEGPFGSFDQMQLQRGLQLYTEVCSACHGMKFVPIRSIGDEQGPGMPEDQVRAYAEMFEVWDPELGDGQGDFRPARPSDNYPAGQMANAPDLSLMAKARAGFHGPYGLGLNQLIRGIGGPEYLHALLTSYTGEQKEEAGAVLYENTAFPSGWIAMPQPLYGDDVTYADGTEATLDQESRDISAFLYWAAEPKLMARKQAGFVGVLMLAGLAVLLYFTNKRIWAPHKRKLEHGPAE